MTEGHDSVVILAHGLGGNAQSTKDAADFFSKHFAVMRPELPGTSLKANAAALDEAIDTARGYRRVYLVAKSLGGVAALMAKKVDMKVLWDPSLDLKWLSGKIVEKDGKLFLREHLIPRELYDEMQRIDPLDLITDEKIILAGAGPYRHFRDRVDAVVIPGASHKFSGYESELYQKTIELLNQDDPHDTGLLIQ